MTKSDIRTIDFNELTSLFLTFYQFAGNCSIFVRTVLFCFIFENYSMILKVASFENGLIIVDTSRQPWLKYDS